MHSEYCVLGRESATCFFLSFAEYVMFMCERIPGIPRVDNVHVQKSLGMRLRKDYTICV